MQNSIIIAAKTVGFRAKLNLPFRTAFGQHDILDNVLFSVMLRDGTVGYGEAGIATHITGETVSQTSKRLTIAGRQLEGTNIFHYKKIAAHYADVFESNPAAQAAFEMALFDAFAKAQRIPLWKLFGKKIRPIQTGMTIVLGTVRQAAKQAHDITKRGIRCVKVKIGSSEELDFKRLFQIAQIVKPRPIYLDANRGLSAKETLWFLKRIRQAGIRPALIEQPVPADDFEGLAKVTREAKIPVAADESASNYKNALRIIRQKSASVINIKLMKFGLIRAQELALRAHAKGIRLMIGQMMESSIATACAAHLACSMPGFRYVDLDAPFFIKERVTEGFSARQNGIYDLRRIKHGIGVRPAH